MNLGALLPIVLLVAVFYLMILRPARNRQKQQQATISSLEVGSRIMTTGGLFGTVTGIEGDQVEIEIADGVRVRYLSAAVSRVIPDEVADDEDDPDDLSDQADDRADEAGDRSDETDDPGQGTDRAALPGVTVSRSRPAGDPSGASEQATGEDDTTTR